MYPMNRVRRLGERMAGTVGLVLALFLAVAGPLEAQEARPVEMTLEEAIEAALRNHPTMVQSRGSLQLAEVDERTAVGSFLPTLSFSTGASLSSTERFNPTTNTTVTGSNDSYSAGLSAGLDLFTGGRRGAELARSRAETESATASLIQQQFAVTLAVKRAFFDALRADDLIRVANARLQRAEEGLEVAERRMQTGTATRSDVLRAQLERTDARQALLEAEAQKRSASYVLGRLVGSEAPVVPRMNEPLEPKPLALSDAEIVALVLESAPTIRSAAAAVKAGDAAARAARAQYLPSLRLSGGYDWFNQDAAFTGGRTSWNVRLGVSYPIFNGFSREAAVDRAEIQADVARAQLQDARRQARAEVERLLANLALARERIALAEEALRVSEEDLRVQQERYRLGASTILDQITSQLNLAQAEVNLIAARYDYQIARAELEALAGREL